jgi:heat shock protein HslJ
MRRSAWAVPILAATLVVATLSGSSSGAGSPGGRPPTQPTAAASRFDGAFAVSALTVEGTEAPLRVPIRIELDSVYGQLTIDTGCNTKLGSFSIFDDGRAGFTVAGGSQLTCTAGPERQEAQLLAVLGEVTSWTESGDGLVLVSQGGDEVELAR